MNCHLISKHDLVNARFTSRYIHAMRVDFVPYCPHRFCFYVGSERALSLLAEGLNTLPLVRKVKIIHIDNLSKILY